MELLDRIREQARSARQRIVLPEGNEERTMRAANEVVEQGIADITLIGNPEELRGLAADWGLEHVTNGDIRIIDPADHPKKKPTSN